MHKSSKPSLIQKIALERLEQDPELQALSSSINEFDAYRFDPERYIRDKLGWTPWGGSAETPGQLEVIEGYRKALLQQFERQAFEKGELSESGLKYWRPGDPIQYRIRIEAGHTVGKTKLCSGLVNHFFDCFVPSIVYTFAPSWVQIHDLLWKEIKADRRGKGLPGRILDLELHRADDHFAKGRATNNANSSGTERIQGQHGKYLMFVLDEAEGIPSFVWGAVDSMTSGGICIVLMPANPRTRSSRFHKAKAESVVQSYRISCLWHPNVLAGREEIPGAVRRQYVEEMIEKHCEVVSEHNPDDFTFEVPWRPGVIYKPDPEFMFRVLGVAPMNIADNTLISPGRYEGAVKREAREDQPDRAWMGVDVARFGTDFGTLYIRHNGTIRRAARFAQQDTLKYAGTIKEEAAALKKKGVKDLRIRVDGGGGFGGGVVDQLKGDVEFGKLFETLKILEVHFGGIPRDAKAYADLVTEMYAEAAETLKGIRIHKPPQELEEDLTERKYKWVNKEGVAVKKLEEKDKFKADHGRSPDDGDGFVLCAAPDFIFRYNEPRIRRLG